MNRPTIYTEEMIEELLERTMRGETLSSITDDEHMPSLTTVYRWMDHDRNLSLKMKHARELGCDAIAENCIAIADKPLAEADASADVSNRKLQIDTRMRLIGKWASSKYGDKATVEHTGSIDHKLSEMDEMEKAKRVALVIAKGLYAAKRLQAIEDQSDA